MLTGFLEYERSVSFECHLFESSWKMRDQEMKSLLGRNSTMAGKLMATWKVISRMLCWTDLYCTVHNCTIVS